MCCDAVDWAAGRDIQDRSAKFVLVMLCRRLNSLTGRLCPTVEELAGDTAQSERTVQRALRWLEAEGYVRRVSNHTSDGRQRANDYVVCMPDLPERRRPARAEQVGQPSPPIRARGDSVTPQTTAKAARASPNGGAERRMSPSGCQSRHPQGDIGVTPLRKREEQREEKTPPHPPEGALGAGSDSGCGEGQGATPPPTFEALAEAYRAEAWMLDDKPRVEWVRLTPAQQTAAIAAASAYAEDCRRSARKPKALVNFLRHRGWAAFAAAAAEAARKPAVPVLVFVRHESPAWAAWEADRRAQGKPGSYPHTYCTERKVEGWWMPSLWPPGHPNASAARPAAGAS